MRRFVTAVIAAVLALVNSDAAFAQSDSGEIRIAVMDAASKQPIGLARVLLDGAVITAELTSADGRVTFTDVPDGIYRARIVKRGYQSLTSAEFEVVNGRIVTVDVALVADTGGLKVIGTVSVKASATISSTSIDQNSPQRRLSDDLAGALNKLSGVSVTTSSDDSDATQTISLEGHDASQTALTLDGIPLNAPGTAGNLRGFATDLFQGASVHTGAQLGGLGGSVNFTTLQPTLSWESQIGASMGSIAKYNYSFAESGSLGKLGLAVQSVYRSVPSLVDGDVYLDASGLEYSHNGDSSYSGNLLKLRYDFGDSQAITGTFLNSARDTNVTCLRQGASPALPCGYGPGNTDDGSVQLYALSDNALLGATQLQAALYSSTATNVLDELDRYVDVSTGPQPEPSSAPNGFTTHGRTNGFSVNATLPAQQRHTISIQAYGSSSQNVTSALVPQAIPYYTGAFSTAYDAVSATDTMHSSDKLTLAESLGVSTATGSGGVTALGSLAATWRPTANDTYNASYAIGGIAATAGRSQILSDPASLRFTCVGDPSQDTAYGVAPGEEPGPSSSISYRLGYTRALRGGTVSLQLYKQIQAGVLLPIWVNGSVLAAQNLLPPGYLQQVQQLYDSAAGCNLKAGTPFDAQQLYFSTPVSGVKRVYQGAELTAYVTLGDLVVQPFYNLTESIAYSNAPVFTDPYSITISGIQLPNQPLQRAGIVFDYKAPHSILEWLADAQYTGRNNPNNLPAYTTFDAGFSAALTRGTITFAASNVTNTFGGVFASPANAVPYATAGGFTIPTIARPLAPRSYSLTYGLKFGEGVTTSQTGAAFAPPRGSQFAGRGGAPGAGGFRSLFSPLPNAPPQAPFAVTTSTDRCSAADAAQAETLSGELQALAARIEAAKTAAGYPTTVPAPALADASVMYHGLGNTYALTIVPKGVGRLRALAGCFTLHVARAEEVTSRHLYAPQTTLFFVPQLNFMPAVGLYFVARQQQAGQESFRVYKLPAVAPKTPFEVRTAGAECTGDARNLATEALAELQRYFSTGSKAANWTIASHAAAGGTWYDLDPSDPSVFAALLQCGRIAATTADELKQRGFDGRPAPELNYAGALGLYFVRPNSGFGPGGGRPQPSSPP
jgi:Carboxypeptidase regulatory-like domain/TonB-dependent Receptor Plug Domain